MRTSRTSSPSSRAIWASALAASLCGPLAAQPIETDETMRRLMDGAADAVGEIACVQAEGMDRGTCAARVTRGPGGRASVHVTFGNGFSRVLHFDGGVFVRANATMSGTGTDADWAPSGDLVRVRVEGQRYDLPLALVFGE